MDRSGARRLQQVRIGRAVPQEIRQPLGFRVAVETEFPGTRWIGLRPLHPEQELRRDQQADQREFQSLVEIA